MMTTGDTNSISGVWRQIHPWEQWDEHIKRADRSQIGTFLNGCAGIVLGGVGAVDANMGVVRKPGKQREWSYGHCTSACSCCIQSKECSTQDNMTVEDDLKVVPFDLVAYKTPYDVRVFRGYIWGRG